MNLATVCANLRNTIAGKEQLLAVSKENLDGSTDERLPTVRALKVTIQFLEINIAELNRILEDVEACVTQTADDWK